jgi:hypothetical protein
MFQRDALQYLIDMILRIAAVIEQQIWGVAMKQGS